MTPTQAIAIADQRSSGLPPQLRAVLGSLTVSLESELNRYRRRPITSSADDDLFADLEDAAFDVAGVDLPASVPTVAVPVPALPPNRKLLAQAASVNEGLEQKDDPNRGAIAVTSAALTGSVGEALAAGTHHSSLPGSTSGAFTTSGYLESSEALIESLREVPTLPEPVDLTQRKRKTVSLLVGATLGFLGLVAGLGASYAISNPKVVQQLADGLQGGAVAIAPAAQIAFDPLGPDLSASEFIHLDLENLSTLNMPQTMPQSAANPQSLPVAPSSGTVLPPIASDGQSATSPATTEIQAAAVPTGLTYYVTVPFSTEQDLFEIRKSVDAAFVRQFADGNRVQLAAFNNPESAQQFIADIKAQGISAQVYGPTAE